MVVRRSSSRLNDKEDSGPLSHSERRTKIGTHKTVVDSRMPIAREMHYPATLTLIKSLMLELAKRGQIHPSVGFL